MKFHQAKDLARGRWPTILSQLGVAESFLVRRHGPCPACGGKDRFRFINKDGDGNYFCNQCGHGDGFDLVSAVNRWSKADSLKNVVEVLGGNQIALVVTANRIQVKKRNTPDLEKFETIRTHWTSSLPISSDDPAGLYLTSRGIRLEKYPKALRYIPRMRMTAEPFSRTCAGMLAAFTSPAGELVQVQRTFLTPDGLRMEGTKKKLMHNWMEGAMAGGAIKLFRATEILGIAEGVETALAAHVLSGLPVWAAYSAGMMAQVVIPDSVQSVVIFADNDSSETGLLAAQSLKKRLCAESKQIQSIEIRMPEKLDTDFADLLLDEGISICQI